MTRNLYIFTKFDVPEVYDNNYQQGLYATEYRNGRALVDRGDNVSITYLQMLNVESLQGYLDGIRDELIFQEEEALKESLN